MKSALMALALIFSASASHAQLVPLFKSLDKVRKGVFGYNMMQGSRSRINVLHGSPQGEIQFQAAYRNETAQKLASTEDFWVGNLFTTNYYELMGEYVYGDAQSSHDLDHATLIGNSAVAMPKASSMVRHWVLERHYRHQFPNSVIGRAFRIRGISDFANEQQYATYFLNFFLTGTTSDTQYLTAWLLAKGSPIATSNSLERARTKIAELYEQAKLVYGANDSMVKSLYALRNAIHNQLSQGVIIQIDSFLRQYGYGDQTLAEIRPILVSYYSVSA
jgi:hypothetical protein